MSPVRVTEALRREARAFYALCDEARRLGVPTSVDDPRSPHTVAGLAAAVAVARSRRGYRAALAADVLAEFGL